MGDILFYSIPEKDVRDEDLRVAARISGIQDKWLPRPIQESNAFARATADLKEEKRIEDVALPNGDQVAYKHTIMVRERPRSDTIRDIVKEVRCGMAQPTYENLGIVRFATNLTEVQVAKPMGKKKVKIVKKSDLEFEVTTKDQVGIEMFNDMQVRVQDMYTHCLQHYTDRDIRNIMVRALKDLDCITIRESGGVFFCPVEHREKLLAIKKFLAAIECEIWVIPVSESVADPSEIGRKLVECVHKEAEKVLRMANEAAQEAKKGAPDGSAGFVSEKKFATIVGKFNEAKQLHAKYQKLLTMDLGGGLIQLRVAERQIAELSAFVQGGK